jgi:AraC family transcriptional regulator
MDVHAVPGHGVPRDEVCVEGVRVVEVAHAPALCITGHAHDVAKICIILDGAASERCGHDVLAPKEFEPVYRRADVPHANQYHVAGARSLIVELDADRRVRDGLLFDRASGRALSARLVAAFGARASSRRRLVRAAVAAMREAFAAARPGTPSWLEASRETLATRSAAPPSLAQLGGALGVHPVYLAQAFRAHWGTTTRAFVRAHRVFQAVELIERGSSLAEAATLAGFADQSHMTRAIRSARGATPGALRRS